MKVTANGQITIPRHIREKLGLLPNTRLVLESHGDTLLLRKANDGERVGRTLVAQMRGRADNGLSTDQIIALMRGEDRR